MTEMLVTGWQTVLASNGPTQSVAANATTWNVRDALPANLVPPFRADVHSVNSARGEVVLVTSVTGLAWTVTRGLETAYGADAAGVHPDGGNVICRITTAALATALASSTIAAVTVSPTGLAAGAALANNGAPFGPDTAGTTTCGIQEAFNSLPACTVWNDSPGVSVTGKTGWVRLLAGVFPITTPITIPAGNFRFTGMGRGAWVAIENLTSPSQDIGGSAIVASAACNGVVSIPQVTNSSSHSLPYTALDMFDMDLRAIQPASITSQTICNIAGHMTGEIARVNVYEFAANGTIGGKYQFGFYYNVGANKDSTFLHDIKSYGTGFPMWLGAAHLNAQNISGGNASSANYGFSSGIFIGQNSKQLFANLHSFSALYGLQIGVAQGNFAPLVVHGMFFESVTHYVIVQGGTTPGTLVLRNPTWTDADPQTDIYSVVPAGFVVLSDNEWDGITAATTSRHVAPPKSTPTTPASGTAFAKQIFDAVFICTAVNGMTGLTLDGTTASIVVSTPIFVGQGHALTATYSGTAPTFTMIPQ